MDNGGRKIEGQEREKTEQWQPVWFGSQNYLTSV